MNKNVKFSDVRALLTDAARVMGGHMKAEGSGNSIRHLGAILGGLLGGRGGSGGGLGGLASMLDRNGDGNPLDDILRMAGGPR
jgi:hypothetical protein